MASNPPADDEFVELKMEPTAEDLQAAAPAPEEEEGGKPEGENAPEGDDASKPEGEEEEGETKPPLQEDREKAKRPLDGRFGHLTRLRHDAERRAEAAEAEVARLKGTASPNGALPGSEAAKPSPDQFEDYGDYVEALTDWKADAREAARADTEATKAAENVAELRNAEWGAKVQAAAELLPDYAEVLDKSADIQVRGDIAATLHDAERGPELIYHLAKHPELLEQLNDMTPVRAAMELGRIEATLEAPIKAPPPAKKTTTAPAPITPVAPGSTTAKDPSKMNMDDYSAWRKSQGIR